LKRLFPAPLEDADLRQFYEGVNRVEPSLIRVEADEVTYNLHILLRFELEQRLVRGDLAVPDLPEAWNGKTEELLGLKPPDDAQGVLQDIHWSGGMFGYFPTYSLGNMYAAQFFNTLKRDITEWQDLVEHGHFESIVEWLRDNIHRHARVYPARDLCTRVTGEPLDPRYLLEYMEEKFGDIYGF
jgi:carboxypeptidase Taq